MKYISYLCKGKNHHNAEGIRLFYRVDTGYLQNYLAHLLTYNEQRRLPYTIKENI